MSDGSWDFLKQLLSVTWNFSTQGSNNQNSIVLPCFFFSTGWPFSCRGPKLTLGSTGDPGNTSHQSSQHIPPAPNQNSKKCEKDNLLFEVWSKAWLDIARVDHFTSDTWAGNWHASTERRSLGQYADGCCKPYPISTLPRRMPTSFTHSLLQDGFIQGCEYGQASPMSGSLYPSRPSSWGPGSCRNKVRENRGTINSLLAPQGRGWQLDRWAAQWVARLQRCSTPTQPISGFARKCIWR